MLLQAATSVEHYIYMYIKKNIKRKTLSWKVTNKNRKEDPWDILFVKFLFPQANT